MMSLMSPTLPLFDELESPAISAREPAAAPHADERADRRVAGRASADRHLRAARRLARAIRRLPDRSDEQTRTGLAICAHLRALLAEADSPPTDT
jgi:hypothetical protein